MVTDHHNLFLLETWKADPGADQRPRLYDPFHDGGMIYPKKNGRSRAHRKVGYPIAIFVGPHVNSFYHFIVEGLSRLVALRPLLIRSWAGSESVKYKTIRLVVPASSQGNGFVDQLLKIFIPEAFEGDNRILRYSCGSGTLGERLTTSEELLHVGWRVTLQGTSMPAHLHGLAPRSLVRKVRVAGRERILSKSDEGILRPVVIVCVRRRVEMRRLSHQDEVDLLETVKETAQEFSEVEVVVFDGDIDMAETIRLFSRAIAVVGVHGGALTNALWAASGCLVLELGFSSFLPAVHDVNRYLLHFKHLADSLDFPYVFVPLSRDVKGRGPGARDVGIPKKSQIVVKIAIEQHLRRRLGRKEEL